MDVEATDPYIFKLDITYRLAVSVNRTILSRRMRWAGYVARMGKKELHTGFWW
jgi:hypothetical protein